jgi:hypothetical protein
MMRDAIYDLFDNIQTAANDTLLFYYSGYGIARSRDDMCLSSSDINFDSPKRRGFTFYELASLVQDSNSIRIVEILGCCYSGAAKISKGDEDDAATIATAAIENKS